METFFTLRVKKLPKFLVSRFSFIVPHSSFLVPHSSFLVVFCFSLEKQKTECFRIRFGDP